jgi:hypothetical protein
MKLAGLTLRPYLVACLKYSATQYASHSRSSRDARCA